VPEALEHPQVAAREMIIEEGEYKAIGIPVKMSRTPGRMSRLPPKYAEHNREVLSAAGFSDDEINRFIEKGVLREETT
ncbi:MAG TPA: carnitine dehydratase, partial [Gammaproteobacteria bacterium]|nr:carnitine dehydratase [Gammaproteobacteria bacterium]